MLFYLTGAFLLELQRRPFFSLEKRKQHAASLKSLSESCSTFFDFFQLDTPIPYTVLFCVSEMAAFFNLFLPRKYLKPYYKERERGRGGGKILPTKLSRRSGITVFPINLQQCNLLGQAQMV